MPRMPKKPKKKKICGLTKDQISHLTLGWCLDSFDGVRLSFPFESEEDRRQKYFENRDFFMNGIGKAKGYGTPNVAWGKRCQAFWDYEAPESRPIVGYEEVDEDFKRAAGACAGGPWPIYEPEVDFLERHGLLLPGERGKAEAFQKAEAEARKRLMEEAIKGSREDIDD